MYVYKAFALGINPSRRPYELPFTLGKTITESAVEVSHFNMPYVDMPRTSSHRPPNLRLAWEVLHIPFYRCSLISQGQGTSCCGPAGFSADRKLNTEGKNTLQLCSYASWLNELDFQGAARHDKSRSGHVRSGLA